MNSKRYSNRMILIFCALTFAFSWTLWIPTALSSKNIQEGAWVIPMLLGGFGPSLSGIILTYWQGNTETRRDFWRRLVDFKRISLAWYLLIFLVFPLSFALIFSVRSLLGYSVPEFAVLAQIKANPLILVGMILAGLVTGPLEEELGWRGYVLDRLQERWTPLVSSLALAPIWWTWHLPLFFIQGTRQSGWKLGSPEFWFFTIGILPLTILLTWAYNCNRRSILAAVLLHFTYNFTMSLVLPLSRTVNLVHLGLLFGTAAAVVILCDCPQPGIKSAVKRVRDESE